MKPGEHKSGLFSKWPHVYLLVIGFLALTIAFLYFITAYFK